MKTLIGVLLATFPVALGIASPAVAAPQGLRVLPASEISASPVGAFTPQITTALDGTATAVWRRRDSANSVIQAATRPPGGSFGAPVDLSAPGRNATSPQITTAPDGTATAVWRRFNGSDFIIQAATRPPGGPFGAPVDLSAPGQDADLPQITTAPDGTATSVWERSTRSIGYPDIIQAATRPPGGSFGAPVDLTVARLNAYSPQIATAPDGTTTAVWIRFSDAEGDIIQAATRPPGGSFGARVDLSDAGQGSVQNQQITTAPDGTATVVWWASSSTIQAATRPPGGSFGAAIDLPVVVRNLTSPQITTAPDGTVTVVTVVWRGRDGVIQAVTRPPGGSFGAPVDLSDPGQVSALNPQITTAPDGTTTAVWRRSDGANSVIQAATRPPGGSFGAPVDLSDPGQVSALNPQITTAPDGTTTAVWRRSDGANSIIQAATRPPGGSFGAPVDLSLEPRLANLKIKPKSKKVRRGKKTTFRVKVKNIGDATAEKLRLCARGPKKLVKLPKCRKPGKLAPGRSKLLTFEVKVKKGARKGRKAKLTFTATAKGATKKSGKATVKIR